MPVNWIHTSDLPQNFPPLFASSYFSHHKRNITLGFHHCQLNEVVCSNIVLRITIFQGLSNEIIISTVNFHFLQHSFPLYSSPLYCTHNRSQESQRISHNLTYNEKINKSVLKYWDDMLTYTLGLSSFCSMTGGGTRHCVRQICLLSFFSITWQSCSPSFGGSFKFKSLWPILKPNKINQNP